MRRQLLPALVMVIVFTVLTGLVYPLVVTGIAQGVFKDKADGSLDRTRRAGHRLALIGQPFTAPSTSIRDRPPPTTRPGPVRVRLERGSAQ